MNAFDNNNENRATVIAVTNDSDPQVSFDKTNTLKVGSSIGIPSAPAVVIPIQDGRDIEKNQNGLGVGNEGDPSYTLDQTGGQAIAFNIHSGSKRADRPEGGMYVNETDIARTLDASGGLEPTKNDGGVAIVAPTLSATNNPSRSPQSTEVTAQVEAMVNATSIVRRLTPVECERLQGFPDDWTAERYDYKKQQVVSQADSARYKQMGNAVAVPVFEWVIARLVAAHTNAPTIESEGVA